MDSWTDPCGTQEPGLPGDLRGKDPTIPDFFALLIARYERPGLDSGTAPSGWCTILSTRTDPPCLPFKSPTTSARNWRFRGRRMRWGRLRSSSPVSPPSPMETESRFRACMTPQTSCGSSILSCQDDEAALGPSSQETRALPLCRSRREWAFWSVRTGRQGSSAAVSVTHSRLGLACHERVSQLSRRDRYDLDYSQRSFRNVTPTLSLIVQDCATRHRQSGLKCTESPSHDHHP